MPSIGGGGSGGGSGGNGGGMMTTTNGMMTTTSGMSPNNRSSRVSSQLCGWVTLYKDGSELVAPRPRLLAGERRRNMELWARRDATDKRLKKLLEGASSKHVSSEERAGPCMAHELADDPQGIAFAYGGIHPGTLHAGGKLMRNHSVRYSIGAAGDYKLHVGLRAQAIPLPGSPFALYVAPSNAHGHSTSLLTSGALPLKGTVGDEWTCECTLHALDRMGNRCETGGAGIVVESSEEVTSQCTDNGDGSYKLEWKGTVSGTYKTAVRIDGVHVLGSPTTIKMFSGPPDVPKCEISGAGLKDALAGQEAMVYITCKDRFDNLLSKDSLQGVSLEFGLALIPYGEGRVGRDTVDTMKYDSSWVKSEGGESLEIRYTAKEAGEFELHVWCDPDGTGVRQWLTGSPFGVIVTGVRPDVMGSFVDPMETDSWPELNAGEAVLLRPQLRDQFGNPSFAEEGTFIALIYTPSSEGEGTEGELRPLKALGLYEMGFDVNQKGPHKVHFLLNGTDITGSPVEFRVTPAAAVGQKSRLYPPSEQPLVNQPCKLTLESIDKYGNRLDTGGARVDARANGPGVSGCEAEDHNDGTYTITFTAAVVGETRVIVRIDNMEMAPMKIMFVEEGGKKKAGGKGKREAEGDEDEKDDGADGAE